MTQLDDDTAEALSLLALDALPPAEAAKWRARVLGSTDLQAELRALVEAVEGAVHSGIVPVDPGPRQRARLLDALETSGERFSPFLERLAARMDLAVHEMRARVEAALDPSTPWTETGVPGVRFVHFEAGPALAGADTGFVRFDEGASFPRHRHHGRELTFVLEGRVWFSSGEVLGPGDEHVAEAGSGHEVVADSARGCLYVTSHEGFEIG